MYVETDVQARIRNRLKEFPGAQRRANIVPFFKKKKWGGGSGGQKGMEDPGNCGAANLTSIYRMIIE